jgi:hypothetical protein
MKLHERAGACSCIEKVVEMVKMIQGSFVKKDNKVNAAKMQDT